LCLFGFLDPTIWCTLSRSLLEPNIIFRCAAAGALFTAH